jgi:hypothetical protein
LDYLASAQTKRYSGRYTRNDASLKVPGDSLNGSLHGEANIICLEGVLKVCTCKLPTPGVKIAILGKMAKDHYLLKRHTPELEMGKWSYKITQA